MMMINARKSHSTSFIISWLPSHNWRQTNKQKWIAPTNAERTQYKKKAAASVTQLFRIGFVYSYKRYLYFNANLLLHKYKQLMFIVAADFGCFLFYSMWAFLWTRKWFICTLYSITHSRHTCSRPMVIIIIN